MFISLIFTFIIDTVENRLSQNTTPSDMKLKDIKFKHT